MFRRMAGVARANASLYLPRLHPTSPIAGCINWYFVCAALPQRIRELVRKSPVSCFAASFDAEADTST